MVLSNLINSSDYFLKANDTELQQRIAVAFSNVYNNVKIGNEVVHSDQFNLTEKGTVQTSPRAGGAGQPTNSTGLGFSHGAGMQTFLAVLAQTLFPVLSRLPPTVCYFKRVFAQRGIVLPPFTGGS